MFKDPGLILIGPWMLRELYKKNAVEFTGHSTTKVILMPKHKNES
jgi:hypothetical protein